MKKEKKANIQLGMGILFFALLLLLGGILSDKTPSDPGNQDDNNISNEQYLFLLESAHLGSQNRVIENYPNFELGAKIENNIIFKGNSFRLNANPFTNNQHSIRLQSPNPENVKHYLLYFSIDQISGSETIIISNKDSNEEIARVNPKNINTPIIINEKPINKSLNLGFEINKPSWYQIFNWNKIDIEDTRVVEISQDTEKKKRDFNFEINKNHLDKVFFNFLISCPKVTQTTASIKITVNNYIISNSNPDCISRNTRINAEVPLNILKHGKNNLSLETPGHYTLTYNLNKVFFNDQTSYKFVINNFNNISDAILYGEFDKDVVDLRINSKLISLKRNEFVSIFEHLKLGTNEIEILTKPVEIKKLAIEKENY